MGSGVSEGPPVPLHPLSGSSSISPLVISSRAAWDQLAEARSIGPEAMRENDAWFGHDSLRWLREL
jgi:hypothetical protein